MKKYFVALAVAIVLSLVSHANCRAAAYAFVTDDFNGTLHIIRLADKVHIGIAQVGSNPLGVAVSPNGDRVYVVNRGAGSVSVLPVPSEGPGNITVTDDVQVGPSPISLAVSPDGQYVYVANRDNDSVSVISSNTLTIEDTISLDNPQNPTGPYAPHGIAVSPNGQFVYTANRDADSVSVIAVDSQETITFEVAGEVPVGNAPIGIAVSPDGTLVCVTNRDDQSVSMIRIDNEDPAMSVVDTVSVGNAPHGIAISPDGQQAYVANRGNNTVSIIDIVNQTQSLSVDVLGNNPIGLAVTPDGSEILVTNYGTGFNDASLTWSPTTLIGFQPLTISNLNSTYTFGQFVASLSAPEQPADLTASTFSDTRIDLAWTDNSLDELGFTIERKEVTENEFMVTDIVGPNETTFSDLDLQPYTAYTYKISAYNEHGDSGYSDPVDAMTGVRLDPPTNLVADSGSNTRIDLSWTDNSYGESGFKIERKTVSQGSDNSGDLGSISGSTSEESFTEIASVGPDVTRFSDEGLIPNTKYRYRVRAYVNASGGTGSLQQTSTSDTYSDYSNEAEAQAADKCFIATAAYGSLLEHHVVTLRRFRDVCLLPYGLGRLFVKNYYTYSPPLAHVIAKHELLRIVVRIGLLPLIAFGYCAIHLSYAGIAFGMVFWVLITAFAVVFLKRLARWSFL